MRTWLSIGPVRFKNDLTPTEGTQLRPDPGLLALFAAEDTPGKNFPQVFFLRRVPA